MAIDKEIINRIRQQTGLSMTQSVEFDILSQAIKDKTKENLGVNTLKRFFGYKTEKAVARVSTLNIIAHFLDYADYESLIKELGEEADISMFTAIEHIEVKDLEKGVKVRFSYDPNRNFLLTYLGDMKFKVEEAKGSRNILANDILTITQLAVGHRLVVAHVERNREDLGPYESAKFKGLKTVEITS